MSRLAVIIGPPVHCGEFARPVAMEVFYRGGPLQRIRMPRVLHTFLALIHRMDKVPEESKLCHPRNDSRPRYKDVYRQPGVHEFKFRQSVVSSGHAIDSHKMHWEEYKISTNKGHPEVEITQFLIHHPPE